MPTETKAKGFMSLDATTLLAAGGFVLVFSLITILVPWSQGVSILAYICIPAGVVPASIALLLGVVEWRRETAAQEFAEWVNAHRRIGMEEMARQLGTTRFETEKRLADAIDRGLVKGVIDRAADEFVLAGTKSQQVFLEKCPYCGGDVNRWAFPEERFTCPYCERAVSVPVVPAAAR